MLTNGGNLYFNQIGEILFFLMSVHIHKYSMANILSLAEVSKLAGVHINMDTSKEKDINVYMYDRRIIHFRACVEGLFYTNLSYPSMVTNPIDTSINPYYFHPL